MPYFLDWMPPSNSCHPQKSNRTIGSFERNKCHPQMAAAAGIRGVQMHVLIIPADTY